MSINKVEISYYNFEDDKSNAIMYCIEDVSESGDNFDRTFICFESEDDIRSDTLEHIERNTKSIHRAIANMDKIEDLIGNNQIRYVGYTTKYWDDVRLFCHSSRFNYAEDVYNLSALELEINKHIKKRFYNKDRIIEACDEGDIDTAIELLKRGEFTKEEMENACQISSSTKKVFDAYFLQNDLVETLLSNNETKAKVNKM